MLVWVKVGHAVVLGNIIVGLLRYMLWGTYSLSDPLGWYTSVALIVGMGIGKYEAKLEQEPSSQRISS